MLGNIGKVNIVAAFRTWTNVSVAGATLEATKQREQRKDHWNKLNEEFWRESGIRENDREILQVIISQPYSDRFSTLPT
jgi:hypothetical protein